MARFRGQTQNDSVSHFPLRPFYLFSSVEMGLVRFEYFQKLDRFSSIRLKKRELLLIKTDSLTRFLAH